MDIHWKTLKREKTGWKQPAFFEELRFELRELREGIGSADKYEACSDTVFLP